MIRHLSARDLKERLSNKGEPPLILDVREDWEIRTARLPDALHIPMRQVPLRLADLPKEGEIVVLCHHGFRSMQVAKFLEGHGFRNLANLTGGIDAWAKDVDPTTPIY